MWSFSQTTYPKLTSDSLIVITPQQLKTTNLIFLEHSKLKIEAVELNKQIASYDSLIKSYEVSDSIQNMRVQRLLMHAENTEQVLHSQLREINRLESRNKLLKGVTIGGITVSVVLLITTLLK